MDMAVERYAELESSYLPDGPDGDSVIHVYVAAVDFQLRFVTMCAAAAVRELDPDQVGMNRSPGFGTFQAFLRKAASFLGSSSQSGSAVPTIELIESTLAEVRGSNGQDAEFGTLAALRNHLFHGNPLPSGDRGRKETLRAKAIVDAVSELIRGYLTGATMSVVADESGLNCLELRWKSKGLALWPFVCVDDAGRLCVLSNFSSMSPTYLRAGEEDVRVAGHGDQLIIALSGSMLPRAADKTFPDFVGEIRADLEGFREPDQPLHHYEIDAEVAVFWDRAVSTGTEPRTDRFRIGDGEQRQWWNREFGRWVSYPDFLRHIVNWPVVARRVRQHLESIEGELVAGERKNLGWTKDSAVIIEPNVKVTQLQNSDNERNFMSFTQLREDIDNRLSARGSRTRIYFVSGEAGIGKTRMLIRTALGRAREIEAEGNETHSQDRLPLFYYVRSTGKMSNSLDTVIDAAAAPTQNLKRENIKALCRNGMIALFIDGFDELLGGVGYDNALGALTSWIEAMGGRGVIVVSARSSYYLNQYTSSLRKEQQRQDLAVEHRVASVQQWNDEQVASFLRQLDVDPAESHTLDEDDRKLLGLPFFARVYAESMNSPGKSMEPLPDLVIHQYLKREAAKLVSAGDQKDPLLNPPELRSTFEGIARTMAEQGTREVEVDDLELVVQDVLNENDLDIRPGLTQRLTTLCGLAVSENPAVDKMFSFQHELFYDIFLADAMLRDLAEEKFDAVTAMLGKTQLRVATFSRLARTAPDSVELLLSAYIKKVSDQPSARQKTYSTNLGSLWEVLIQRTGSVKHVEITDLIFGALDLTKAELERVTFANCQFESLTLPPARSQDMRLVNCTIESMWVERENMPLRGISSFKDTTLSQLIRHGALVEKPQEVQQALHELGAPVLAVEKPDEENQFMSAVQFYLENFSHRVDTVVVYERNLAPADDNRSWQMEYGIDAWTAFVRLLTDSGAGRLNTIDAAGAPVLRVKIHSIERLRNREVSADDAVATFWEQAESQNVKIT